MDEKTIQALQYDEVLRILQSLVTSPLGQEAVQELKPSDDPRLIEELLEETSEMKAFLEEKGWINVGFPQIDSILLKAQRGSILEGNELRLVSESIKASRFLKEAFSKLDQRFYRLKALSERLRIPLEVEKEIDKGIDSKGEIRDEASEALVEIRSKITKVRKKLLDGLKIWVEKGVREGILGSDIITERNGRYVVLLRSSNRGRAKGIVHGISSSGASLYFEPIEIVEFNNELEILRQQEEEEIERILRRLSLLVGEHAKALKEDLEVQKKVDLLYGKARLSILLKGIKPEIKPNEGVRLLEARHPLLELRGKKVVPVDLLLEPTRKILILSGANAGGKTVALKTLGLLTLMAQSGLLIPVKEGSHLPIFKKVFAYIGDEQDLSQDLSTFSSFLNWLKGVLPEIDEESLLLIDEMGSGTDQVEGPSFSMAILDEIRRKGGYALVTTHLDPLKAYGFVTPGVRNASVGFDEKNLSPTYQVLYDTIGRSFTFFIARKWDLPGTLLEDAESYKKNLEGWGKGILEELSRLKEQFLSELQKAKELREELEKERASLKELWEFLKAQRREILRRAEERARRLLLELEEKIKEMKKELEKADRKKVLELSQDLRKLKEKASKFGPKEPLIKVGFSGELKEGDWALIKSLGAKGQVLRLNEKNAELIVGGMRVKASLEDLLPMKVEEEVKLERVSVEAQSYGVPEINVRGLRVEEALKRVEKLLDEALIRGWDHIEIIHGIGTGALRRAIRDYFKGMPYVKAIKSAPREKGGEGVTIVELR
jgi:DNA mismatch repair protein MutS2